MDKAPDAFKTISEVAAELDLPQYVLRFWETRFSQIKPLKRGGGRRYYRPDDVDLLKGIRSYLYGEGYTIRGVQRILKERGLKHVADKARQTSGEASSPVTIGADADHAAEYDSGYLADAADTLRPPDSRETSGAYGADQATPRPVDAVSIAAPQSALAESRQAPPRRLSIEDKSQLQAAFAALEECRRLLETVR